ncbi:MAG: hypothetical protein U1E73_12275 [Planctomycetota bacterium]
MRTNRIQWGRGILLAAPAVAFLLGWRFGDGWLATASAALLFASVAAGIAIGCRYAIRWQEDLEDDPGR